jgi:hypothetical protein
MSLISATPLAPKLCNFLDKQEIVRNISNQDISSPLQFHTRTNDWTASPKTTSTRSRVQHRHFPTPSSNLPRYPGLGVATTIVDRNNFCKPTGSNNCCWQKHVRHETKTPNTYSVHICLGQIHVTGTVSVGRLTLQERVEKDSSERVEVRTLQNELIDLMATPGRSDVRTLQNEQR